MKTVKNCFITILIITGTILLAGNVYAAEKILFDWNDPGTEGKNWSGWTWSADANTYGSPGWTNNAQQNINKYPWSYGLASFMKGDYGNSSPAVINSFDRAPSTSSGNSFKVYDDGNSATNQSSWWVWYDGIGLGKKGYTDSETNRMDFYIKTTGMQSLTDDGGIQSISNNVIHVGTYLCWDGGKKAYGSGDGCPYEGPGNQHYYHYLGINNGTWIHALLDSHPTHRRGSSVSGNDPSFIQSGKHYMEHLNQFYMEIRSPQNQPTSMSIDELKFYSTNDTVEPNQNDDSITSLWTGYWSDSDNWEIGWSDMSFDSRNDYTWSTFEIRWSTSPITNANYANAARIQPLFYAGDKYSGDIYLLRRPNSWAAAVWTRFKLPDDIEQNNNRIYFAIKDVSDITKHAGSNWPYNKIDGHNAPSDNIHIIDYNLRPDNLVISKPSAPTGFKIRRR